MTEPRVTVRGDRAVVDALEQVRRQAEDLTEINRRVVARLIPEIESRSPTRTGELRGSWSVGATATAGEIRSSSGHAAPVEAGVPSRGIAPVRMVARTIADHHDEIVKGYEQGIADAGARANLEVAR